MTTFVIILVVIIGIALWAVGVYNHLVKLRNQADEGWSGIDVQLKRRYNLIPNLLETVKGYQKHESSVLEEVTSLRGQAMGANNVKDRAVAESALSMGLGRLFAVAESYPDLKASKNFSELQQSLNQIEDEIQLARRYYNGTVRMYNTKIQSFPDVLVARNFNFSERDFFELSDEAQRAVPKVDFS